MAEGYSAINVAALAVSTRPGERSASNSGKTQATDGGLESSRKNCTRPGLGFFSEGDRGRAWQRRGGRG